MTAMLSSVAFVIKMIITQNDTQSTLKKVMNTESLCKRGQQERNV